MPQLVPKFLCLLFLLLATGVPVGAQETVDAPQLANLILRMDENGSAELSFNLTHSAPLTEQQIQAINQALGFPVTEMKEELGEGEPEASSGAVPLVKKWFFYYGKGTRQFQKQGLRVQDNFDVAPLLDALKPFGVESIQVTVAHPVTEQTQVLAAQDDTLNAINNLGLQSHHFPIKGAAQQSIKIEYGHSSQALFSSSLVLIIVLAFPVFATALLIGAVLRKYKINPQETNLSSLGGFNLIVHLAPILWWVALYYTRATDLVAPWLKSQSPWISHPTRIAIYALPPIIVSLICNAIYQFGVAIIKRETKRGADLLAQSALNVLVSFVPMILLYNGIFMIVRGEVRQAVFFFVSYILLQSFAAKWQWKAMGFTPYILPNGILRHRIHALANKAGVKLQQIFLIADKSGQTANAFAATGNNLMLTEFLLAQFSRREIDFIASHEITHLQLNHTSKKSLITLITFPIMVLFAVFFGIVIGVLGIYIPSLFHFVSLHAYPVILLFAICCSTLIELFISRRFEYQADAGAIRLTNDPEAAISALARLGRLNFEPMQWGKFNGKFLTHPSVYYRIQAIARRHNVAPDRVQQLLNLTYIDHAKYTVEEDFNALSVPALGTGNNKLKHNDLPQGKQIPFTLAPLLFACFGICIAWLLTTPGYFLRQILDEYNVPSYLVLLILGSLFASWKCLSIKNKILGLLAERVIFNQTCVLDSPTITTVSEMDEILHFTNDLRAAGFLYVADYQVVTEPRSRAMGFVRVFIHPVYKCYAEVTQIVNILNRPRPIACTIISDFGAGWSLATTNREFDGVAFALRTPQSFWNSNPLAHPLQLLEMHLEQRESIAKHTGRAVEKELSVEIFQAHANTLAQLRKATFKRKYILQFLLEADFCSTKQKREWLGNIKTKPKKASSVGNNPSLAPQAKH